MAESQDDQMQSVVTCDTCDETAEHLCITCQDRLCPRCKEVHSRSKASFDHEVVLLSSSSISQAHEERFSSQQVCSKHAGYRISICCGDCDNTNLRKVSSTRSQWTPSNKYSGFN